MKIIKFLMLTLTLFVSSCATIVSSSTQSVSFLSNPSDSKIIINGIPRGNTPAVIDLKRKTKIYTIKFEKKNYKTKKIVLERKINGWVWGNLLLGGIVGLVVDYSTGAIYKIPQEEVSAELIKQGRKLSLNGSSLIIGVTMAAKDSWKKIGYVN